MAGLQGKMDLLMRKREVALEKLIAGLKEDRKPEIVDWEVIQKVEMELIELRDQGLGGNHPEVKFLERKLDLLRVEMTV